MTAEGVATNPGPHVLFVSTYAPNEIGSIVPALDAYPFFVRVYASRPLASSVYPGASDAEAGETGAQAGLPPLHNVLEPVPMPVDLGGPPSPDIVMEC